MHWVSVVLDLTILKSFRFWAYLALEIITQEFPLVSYSSRPIVIISFVFATIRQMRSSHLSTSASLIFFPSLFVRRYLNSFYCVNESKGAALCTTEWVSESERGIKELVKPWFDCRQNFKGPPTKQGGTTEKNEIKHDTNK